MSNFEMIKSMNKEEFAAYINSVFLAGRLYEKNKGKDIDGTNYEMVDYTQWLDSHNIEE